MDCEGQWAPTRRCQRPLRTTRTISTKSVGIGQRNSTERPGGDGEGQNEGKPLLGERPARRGIRVHMWGAGPGGPSYFERSVHGFSRRTGRAADSGLESGPTTTAAQCWCRANGESGGAPGGDRADADSRDGQLRGDLSTSRHGTLGRRPYSSAPALREITDVDEGNQGGRGGTTCLEEVTEGGISGLRPGDSSHGSRTDFRWLGRCPGYARPLPDRPPMVACHRCAAYRPPGPYYRPWTVAPPRRLYPVVQHHRGDLPRAGEDTDPLGCGGPDRGWMRTSGVI